MPDQDYYDDLRSLRERLRRFAEHHYHHETRHISRFEYEMLLEAAALLPDDPDDGEDASQEATD